MDYTRHFQREAAAFEAAIRHVDGDAPLVPSCPGWSVSDLTLHLGMVHRLVAKVIQDRMPQPPNPADHTMYDFPTTNDWPEHDAAPNLGPVPANLADWFATGATTVATLFAERDPSDSVWTWWTDQNVGFWQRMQAIEAAVHRWDAENAVGTPNPIDAELATDTVSQTFEVMAPARRFTQQAPPGSGERFRFRQTDGDHTWTVMFDGDAVRLVDDGHDVEIAGTASDLALFLWQRLPADELTVDGDRAILARYFTLVPPV